MLHEYYGISRYIQRSILSAISRKHGRSWNILPWIQQSDCKRNSCLRRYTLNYKYQQYSHYLVSNKTFHGSRYDK